MYGTITLWGVAFQQLPLTNNLVTFLVYIRRFCLTTSPLRSSGALTHADFTQTYAEIKRGDFRRDFRFRVCPRSVCDCPRVNASH